ncbi:MULTISPECIES: hypothetical protein [Protofrankia]|uniref:Minor tail T domain-containing protein n=1 Tax=Protofrankia coriariae TaxID=1562887 RepID=A0ABR5F4C1_9ACTN|nr:MULTISPECIES: hypothetical protein [Protofrankia]KLL11576.1 hypothetical protein FrCorBMG51_11110 [Protofrankia coriariae]ONH35711.1 hypothetical protein BL254_10505 [Protofrankia sp. BMG5.30]
MPPSEVLDRFTEREIIRMIAYQNLYGPVTPRRYDLLVARLGMDVVSPHMKRGRRPHLRDHLIVWSRRRARKTPQEILAAIKGIQAGYDVADQARRGRRR